MRRGRIWLLVGSLTALGATRAAASEDDLKAQPKRRFLALPYLGVHSRQDDGRGLYYGPGLRFGSLVGGRVNDSISLNADLTFDIANVDSALGDREWSFDLALGPLFHLWSAPVEIVLGPKAGIFRSQINSTAAGMAEQRERQGLVLGLNTGVFLPVSAATSLGLLLSYELRVAQRVCVTQSGNEACVAGGGGDIADVLGLTAAVLF